MRPRRRWADARAKVEREGACRTCGEVLGLQAAHLTSRKYDLRRENGDFVVSPVSVVPLCPACHDRYDGRQYPRLDLLGHLTAEEEARAVLDLGLENARMRLAPSLSGQVAV